MHPDYNTLLSGLNHEGLIRVSGADAAAFLQGQLSTDMEKLTPKLSQLSSWSNAKGRVVTLLQVFRWDDDIFMTLPSGLLPVVLKKLGLYVLRSKVTLTDYGKETARIGLAGEEAPLLLSGAGIPVPKDIYAVTDTEQHIKAIRLYGALPRYALYGPADDIASLKQKLEIASAQRGNEDAWALAKILAGEPTVYPETSEHFVAPMLGLNELGGIDYKKGCYIGQEVIARAHYRGGVKLHMVSAECETTSMLKPGMDIHDVEQNLPVAEVVDARMDESGVWRMLLVIQDDFRNTELVHVASGSSVKLH